MLLEPTITVLSNPFDTIRDPRQVPAGATVLEAVPYPVVPDGSWTVVENGRVLRPDEWAAHLVTPGSELIAYPAVHGGKVGLAIGVTLLVIAAVATMQPELLTLSEPMIAALVVAGIGMVAGGVMNLLMPKPSVQVAPSLTNSDAGSNTYGFGGIGNTARSGSPITVVYGLHRAGGQYISLNILPEADNDVLYALIGVSEGLVSDIYDVQINEQPVANYNGITIDTRFGANTQASIPFFGDHTSATYGADAALTTSYITYTTVGTNINALELNVTLPGGIYDIDSATGSFQARTVTIIVQYKLHSSGTWLDSFSSLLTTPLVAPTPTLAESFEGMGGFLSFGLKPDSTVYSYAVSQVTTHGETLVGPTVTLTLSGSTQRRIKITIPVSADPTVVGQRVYAWSSFDPTVRFIGTTPNSTAPYNNAVLHILNSQGTVTPLPILDTTTGEVVQTATGIPITDARRTTLRRTVRIDNLASGQYDIRVKRTNDASTSPSSVDDIRRTSVTEIIKDAYTYPNLAMLAVRALATDQLSGSTPTITAMVRGVNVKVFSDVSTYLVVWSNNPAWIVFDMLTNTRYGLGRFTWPTLYSTGTLTLTNGSANVTIATGTTTAIKKGQKIVLTSLGRVVTVSSITSSSVFVLTANWDGSTASGLAFEAHRDDLDIQSFIDWASYCDQGVVNPDGTYEQRATCNFVFDSNTTVWDAVLRICTVANGQPVKIGNYIKIKIEQSGTPAQLFTMANIVTDSFEEVFLSLKDRLNSFDIQFLNEDNDYKQDMVNVEDPLLYTNSEQPRKNTVALYGVTRTTHAARLARFFYNVNRYVTRTITFEVGIDAVAVEPGDLIRFQHDVPQWGNGGRAAAGSTSTTIVLDHTVSMTTGLTYQVLVRHSATDVVETFSVTNPGTGSYSTLTITGGPWASTPAVGDVWAFGETSIATKPFRVVSIERTPDLTAKIAAVEYNASIYDDSVTADVTTVQYSTLPDLTGPPDPVTNLAILEESLALDDKIWVSWTTPGSLNFRAARVYRSDLGVDEFLGESTNGSLVFPYPLTAGIVLQVKVTSLSTLGVESSKATAPTASITVGAVVPPDLSVLTFFFNGTVPSLAWNPVVWPNQIFYEVRKGSVSWEDAISVGFTVNTNMQTAGDGTYWVKPYDSLGNYADNAASVVAVNSTRIDENVYVTIDEGGTGFLGTVTGSALVTGGQVVLSGSGLVDAIPDVDAVAGWDAYGGLSAAGSYTIPTGSIVDIGVAKPCKLTHELTINALSSGNVGDDVLVYEEMQLAQDDGILGSWTSFIPGTYVGRKFNFRITLTPLASDVYQITLSQWKLIVDMPDLVEKVYNFAVPSGGYGVALTTPFQTVPTVHVQIINATAGDDVILTGQTTSFFAVQVKNGGVGVARNINYTAIGY